MKYKIKHIDIPGILYEIKNKIIELPDNIIPFKIDFVLKKTTSEIIVIDSLEELNKLIFDRSYRYIESGIVVVAVDNGLVQYNVSTRFYYLEKQDTV